MNKQVSKPARPDSSLPVDLTLALWMIFLTSIWGMNAITIKYITDGVTPVMAAGLRGATALPFMILFAFVRGESLRFRGWDLVHGGAVAVLFALEFIFIYSGAKHTNGGHIAIFINTTPLFVALGAHFFLPGEQLHTLKSLGLLAAFGGVVVLFSDSLGLGGAKEGAGGYWKGDLLVMGGALMWASMTLYIKRFITASLSAFRMLYIQILISTLILLVWSALAEENHFFGVSTGIFAALAFQGVVVVFFSYLMWTVLIKRYNASGMLSFAFLAPVWGVSFGVLLLGERVTGVMMGGIALVSLGLFLVNRPPGQLFRAK